MQRGGTNFDDIAESISALSTMIDGRFISLENRFSSLEDRFGNLEDRVGGLETRMGGLEVRVGGLEAAQRETNERLDTLDGKTDALLNDVKELYQLVH